jgi:CBS domain-containing protein
MSLERYRRSRLVVLRPGASAYEAARAMADNHIGAVLIAEDQHLSGIATDRDVALDVVGGGLPPQATTVREVMTDEVVCLEIGATVQDAVGVMLGNACRRVPLVEGGRPVGLVTLDDLLLEGDIDLETARSILRAQLEVEAPLKPAGATHPTEPARPWIGAERRAWRRSLARAESTYGRLLRAVQERTGLSKRQHAEAALLAALSGLVRRLMPSEAKDFIAQLPSRLQPELERHATGPDRGVTADSIRSEIEARLGVDAARAEEIVGAVLQVVSDGVSAGEIEDVRSQLPLAMKDLVPEPWLRRAG